MFAYLLVKVIVWGEAEGTGTKGLRHADGVTGRDVSRPSLARVQPEVSVREKGSVRELTMELTR